MVTAATADAFPAVLPLEDPEQVSSNLMAMMSFDSSGLRPRPMTPPPRRLTHARGSQSVKARPAISHRTSGDAGLESESISTIRLC